MVYPILSLAFILFFLLSYKRKEENKKVAYLMGLVLFLLVALRGIETGPDTFGYVMRFLNKDFAGMDKREQEPFFVGWTNIWNSIFPTATQLYLIVCAIASIGLVLITIWKSSIQKVWSYTLFLVMFQWYFYLSGIRQGMAIGCLATGAYLLSKNIQDLSLWSLRNLFRHENVLAFVFIILAPLFHMTALFGVVVVFAALFMPKNTKTLYIVLIIVSFLICLSAVFKEAENMLVMALDFVGENIEIVSRYESYADANFIYNTKLYLILKDTLPLNIIAIYALVKCKRDYDTNDRIFFALVILSNLFYYFPYMFRLKLYLYPVACIAIANMLWPSFRGRKITLNHVFLFIFILANAYINVVNIGKEPAWDYHFCF